MVTLLEATKLGVRVQADAQLDEVLTTLAHQLREVLFLRTPLSGFRSPVVTQLGILCESGEDSSSLAWRLDCMLGQCLHLLERCSTGCCWLLL